MSGVVALKGMLYGATIGGGIGSGSIFSVDPSTGNEKVIYSFSDGGFHGALTSAGAYLYGSTDEGGASGCGMVFRLNSVTGNFENLYNLPSGYCDEGPLSGLLKVGKVFYGETPSSVFKFVP
jgi:uncharacterized repeat protein (TIGR03803 family)